LERLNLVMTKKKRSFKDEKILHRTIHEILRIKGKRVLTSLLLEEESLFSKSPSPQELPGFEAFFLKTGEFFHFSLFLFVFFMLWRRKRRKEL